MIGEIPKLNALVVRADAQKVQRALDKDPRSQEEVDFIEPDGPVSLFASGCTVGISWPTGQPTPTNISRVGGPMQIATGVTRKVWVVDTGIAVAYDQSGAGELNVDRSRSTECNPGGCSPASDPTKTGNDTFGHGTAVAGIIGAIDNGMMTVGVAPGATLVAVKASMHGEIKWSALYHALDYVLTNAGMGDVVNLSLGASWDPDPRSIEREIERLILEIADVKDARIAIAAGNLDMMEGPAYVPAVTPARAAIYPDPTPGVIMAVSAMDASDSFWPESGYGNGEQQTAGTVFSGPPEVAEPGVAIDALALGPSFKLSCTGTSFAAAHLSGILLQGAPSFDGQVTADIDTDDPETGMADTNKNDRIGVCTPGQTGTCIVSP